MRQRESEGKKLSGFLKFIFLCLITTEVVKKIDIARMKFNENKTAKT